MTQQLGNPDNIDVEWDESKNRLNQREHEGITFEEAATVFFDPLAIATPDDEHADEENRFHIIGESALGRMLVVTYMERRDKIRLISARRPTRGERREYEEGD